VSDPAFTGPLRGSFPHPALAEHSQERTETADVLDVGQAVEARRAAKAPYMPLLKRTHEGRPLWFIRFVDFESGEEDLADLHMVVVGGEDEALLHKSTRIRVWSPATLEAAFEGAGFADVDVSARIGEPGVPPATEDVFVHARAP